jgi:hypothetical protein
MRDVRFRSPECRRYIQIAPRRRREAAGRLRYRLRHATPHHATTVSRRLSCARHALMPHSMHNKARRGPERPRSSRRVRSSCVSPPPTKSSGAGLSCRWEAQQDGRRRGYHDMRVGVTKNMRQTPGRRRTGDAAHGSVTWAKARVFHRSESGLADCAHVCRSR